MRILSTKTITFGFITLLVAIFATVAANAIAQEATYGGQMTLNWTIDTFCVSHRVLLSWPEAC
jgi:hypothetical protein